MMVGLFVNSRGVGNSRGACPVGTGSKAFPWTPRLLLPNLSPNRRHYRQFRREMRLDAPIIPENHMVFNGTPSVPIK
jgi:hypothetical protein